MNRAQLAIWVGAASALLRPLVDAIRHHVLAASKLHADDTPILVLAPGNGKTKTARLWAYVRDDRPCGDTTPPAVCFAYTPDRKGIHPQTHLAKFESVLQADAYAGFNALFDDGTVREAACWAHYPECSFIWSKIICQQRPCGRPKVQTPHKIDGFIGAVRTRVYRRRASTAWYSLAQCRPSSKMPPLPPASFTD